MRAFGRYRLVELLASGGMADVWRAEGTGAEGVVKEVALKLVRGEHGARSDFVRMFIEEARLASRLGHANVVQVFEFDQVDGRYFIAMELVRGHHLGRVAERARELGIRLGLPRAVHVGAEIARALAYAHRLAENGRPVGLVHRDVSPHNVLVSFEGEVKLADFGIARAMGQAGLTAPGTLKGKLAYMAPEQARGEAVDARADVFALGVILWELCAGRRLFARESEGATFAAVLGDEAISPPSAWNEDVPPELDAAVLGALQRDRDRRTGSAQELAGALASILLRITRSPDDVDLRRFMHRLWPEGWVAGSSPEPTRVRPPPEADEPGGAPAARDELAAAERAAEAARSADESLTRTSPAPAARAARAPRRRAWGVSIAVAVGCAVTAAVLLGTRGGATSHAEETATATSTPTPTPTSTPTATPTPTPPPSAAPAEPRRRAKAELSPVPPGIAREVGSFARLVTPPASSGQGVLSVNATPWGIVSLNGVALGDAPLAVRLPAGRYRLRVELPNRVDSRVVTISAGEREPVVLFSPR